MARYLLLHGFGGVGPDHWLVWLSTELRARGHVARIRKLPSPNAPDLDVWRSALADRLTYLGGLVELDEHGNPTHELDEQGDPSGELVVVAHSLGGRLWLQHAQEAGQAHEPGDAQEAGHAHLGTLAKTEGGDYPFALADRVALVSPPLLPENVGRTRFHDLDLARVDPSRAARHTRVVVSTNDPYWPDGGAVEGFANPLGLPVDLVGDRGHFEPKDGFGPWPGLLAWCLGDAETITD